MAKKSLISGEYIIEIADNGHVDIVRVFRNAKVVMEELAKSKDFHVEDKWNTQDLGRHLVKEFGDGKSAQFDDIIVNKLSDGKIEIYQECKNVKDALRTIAAQLDFKYDEEWNTQTFGSKLADYGSYDFLWDVHRIQVLAGLEEGNGVIQPCQRGFAVILTNDIHYWRPFTASSDVIQREFLICGNEEGKGLLAKGLHQ